jgi:hypothetical protein
MRNRCDETWHRLRERTKGQTPSERLAAQILANEGFTENQLLAAPGNPNPQSNLTQSQLGHNQRGLVAPANVI